MIFHSYVSLPEGNSQAWNKAFCGWLPLRTIICCSSSSMTSVILQCTFLSSFLCPKSMFRVKSWKDLRNTNWAAIFQCVASKKKQNDTGELEDPSIWFTDSKCVCPATQHGSLEGLSLLTYQTISPRCSWQAIDPIMKYCWKPGFLRLCLLWPGCSYPVSGPNPYMTYVIYVCIYI